MLIIALVLILLVCVFVALHFFLKRRKRRRKAGDGKEKGKKKKKNTSSVPETPTPKKEVVELVGTPICELGDPEPRHEMEDVEVHERHMATTESSDDDGDRDVEAGQSGFEAGTSWYDETDDRAAPEPESREFALYWSRGI